MQRADTNFVLVSSLALILFHGISLWAQNPAKKTFPEVVDVQKKYEAALFQNPSVQIVAIGWQDGSKEWALSVYVLPGTPAVEIPADLEGVPVRIKETGPIDALDGGAAHRRQQSLPIKLGASTSNTLGCFAGTMAFKVCEVDNPSLTGYLTNNHVATAAGTGLCPNEAPRSTWETHVARYDNDCRPYAIIVGFLERYVRIDYRGENMVDAAFVKEFGRNTVSEEILDIGFPTHTPRDAEVGDVVRKSGRTTGDTTSRVIEVNATTDVSYGSCGTARFTGQIIADNAGRFVDAGDSGSPVVDEYNNPVGLVFAGSDEVAVFNPVLEVLAQLNVQLDCNP